MIMIVRNAALAGAIIAEARAIAGHSNAALSQRSGIDGSRISKYELSRAIPDLSTLQALLRACGFSLAALPTRDAETYEAREAVVVAARDAYTDHIPLIEALRGLDRADASGADTTQHPHPSEEIVRLREENARLLVEVTRLREEGPRLQQENSRLMTTLRSLAETISTMTGRKS